MRSPEDLPGAGGAPRGGAREGWRDPLPPLVSAALDEGGEPLLARLRRIAAQSAARERYAVLGEIGRGGMGRVLRVWDRDLQRELARKEISLAEVESASDETRGPLERSIARFIDEARITGQLHHPGIVPVHEIGVDPEGSLYFTMPLVRGRSLQDVFDLARHGREGWNLHRALGVLLEVVLAVAYAHSRDVIHRDLKPSNVMVGPFGETYVLDWGLALLLGRSDGGAVVGTPAYMAPEQARGEVRRVGPHSDVYSLGAMLYELLARRMPHETTLAQGGAAGSPETLAGRPPRTLLDIDPKLPPELVAICEKAMAQDPAARYASAMDLAGDLRAWLEGRVVPAYDSSTWARVSKWRRRNRGLAFALEALLALVVASVTVVLVLQRTKIEAIAAEREAAEHKGYAASLRAAGLAFELGTPDEARRFLAACAPELRGWAWRHLAFRADTSLLVLAGHGDSVTSVAVHPDGGLVATGSSDGSVRTWSPEDGSSRVLPAPHDAAGVEAVAWSPDGVLLAAGRQDGALHLWDARSGEVEASLETPARSVTALAWAPDGSRLASGGRDGDVLLWDPEAIEGGPRVLEAPSGSPWVLALAWHPLRPWLAAALSDGRLVLWDARDGRKLETRQLGSTVFDLAFRPDGTRLALASLDEGLQIVDPEGLETLLVVPSQARALRAVAWSPDGRRLLSGSTQGSLRLWDPRTGEQEAVLFGHEGTVRSIAWLPDGVRFVSGAEDDTARVWSTDSRDASTLAPEMPGSLLAPRVRYDGTRVAFADAAGTVRVYAPSSAELVGEIRSGETCTALDFPPEPGTLAIAVADVVRVLDVADGSLVRELAGVGDVKQLLVAPRGPRLLARGLDDVLRLWDTESGELVAHWDDTGNLDCGLAFDPRGETLAVGSVDGTVHLHDAADGALRGRLATGGKVYSVTWTPEGDVLAIGAGDDLLLQDMDETEPYLVLAGHKHGVKAVAFSGNRIATASYDTTVRIWERTTGELLLTLPGEGTYVDVAFDADEDALVASLVPNRVRVWRTRLPAPAR